MAPRRMASWTVAAAVLVGLIVTPACASARSFPGITFKGTGKATWAHSPADFQGSDPTWIKTEGGTATWHEFGIPNRRLEMKLGHVGFTNTPPDRHGLQITATITEVVGRFPSACREGGEVIIQVYDHSLPQFDPKTKKNTLATSVTIGSSECRLGYGYTDGHAHNQVDITLDPDRDDARPWSEGFKFKAYYPGSGCASSCKAPPLSTDIDVGWSMARRYGEHVHSDGVDDEYSTAEEVTPKHGFTVHLDARPCPEHNFAIAIDGRHERLTDREKDRCEVTVGLDEGKHHVVMTGKRRDGGAAHGSKTIHVQDWLVVGLGDSIGSGEGDPDIPRKGDEVAHWKNRRCHRSKWSYQSRVAEQLENHDSHTSVTFLHLACSGAAVGPGLTGGYGGIVNPGQLTELPGQLDEMKDLVNGREIDAVILSIGANDLRFGGVLLFCVEHSGCPDTTYDDGKPLRQWMADGFASGLPNYAAVAGGIPSEARDRVYIVQYPDPLREEDGTTFCDSIVSSGIRAITADEAQWTFENFLLPLNGLIQGTAGRFGWNVIRGAQQSFAPHGYCAEGSNRWMVQLLESRAQQGDFNGTMHPNRRGHHELAKLVRKPLFQDLYPEPDRPRAPRP